MRTVFVDTFYWLALASPIDEWHHTAITFSRSLERTRMITTDEVLTEFLTGLSGYGVVWRRVASEMVRNVLRNPNIRTLPQTRTSFDRGLRFYESRPDKEYSLTDCISMEVMREHGLHEVLTHDHDFEQESFAILMKQKLSSDTKT